MGTARQPEVHESQNIQTATFAGGCFWCVESAFDHLDGVISAVSGYMGGTVKNPSYEEVSSGTTGHVEVVQVQYNPEIISYERLLEIYWMQIDPTDPDGQFVDRGQQYRSVIYYHTDEQQQLASLSKEQLEQTGKYAKPIVTEISAASDFYPAEDYHQDYHLKNKLKYAYYRYASGRDQFVSSIWQGDQFDMQVPQDAEQHDRDASDDEVQTEENSSITPKRVYDPTSFTPLSESDLRQRLTSLQYEVTQNDATEPAFQNEYWDNKEAGIYVDIISGEPLFSSTHKYDSGTGWPSFYQAISDEAVAHKRDFKLIWPRTEVRSVQADSHLGHVFNDGPEPTGKRYCMNSAAMRFVPLEDMVEEGYGDYVYLFEGQDS